MFNFGKFSGKTAPREKKEQIKLYLHTSQLNQIKFIYTPHISKTSQGCLQCENNTKIKNKNKTNKKRNYVKIKFRNNYNFLHH